jgi:aminopeptidase N
MSHLYTLLEEDIQLLENLSLNPPDLPQKYAQALIDRFQNATKEEAFSLAADAFKEFYQEMKIQDSSPVLLPPTLPDKPQVDQLIQENSMLKKAVVKLKAKNDLIQNIERENFELKAKLQQMGITNYMLRMHLQNALEGKNEIESEKDIF